MNTLCILVMINLNSSQTAYVHLMTKLCTFQILFTWGNSSFQLIQGNVKASKASVLLHEIVGWPHYLRYTHLLSLDSGDWI